MTGFTLRHSCALGALATAALYASPAFAQAEVETAGAATQNDNRIVVTGSYIRGTPEDAALPVDVFTADDLAEQGVDSPLEFIKELPSVGASLGDSNQFSTDAQGFQGVGSLNLRGLGPQRTLVLLNGKRTMIADLTGTIASTVDYTATAAAIGNSYALTSLDSGLAGNVSSSLNQWNGAGQIAKVTANIAASTNAAATAAAIGNSVSINVK